jgi:hypothetical protein
VHVSIYRPNEKLRILSRPLSLGVLKAQKQINVTKISEHLFAIDGDNTALRSTPKTVFLLTLG